MRAPTGEQFVLSKSSGSRVSRAIITEVAASLRELTVDGVHITEPYPVTSTPPFGCGIVLAPWPNRVEDGRWVLDGQPQQLDITEPDRGNALHGLLRYSPYKVVSRDDCSITLAATIYPQHGYPFLVDTTVRYSLDVDGLTVTHSATSHGALNHAALKHNAAAAPVAFGVHPFFRIGDVPVDDLVLSLAATTRFETDARLNPIGEVATAGTKYELSGGVAVSELQLDDAFGGLEADGGRFSTLISAPDGRSVTVWQEADWGYIQVFTTRDFPAEGGTKTALAVEPMTAPPNALNSGLGLRWLEQGETWSTSWGVTYDG